MDSIGYIRNLMKVVHKFIHMNLYSKSLWQFIHGLQTFCFKLSFQLFALTATSFVSMFNFV